MDIMANGLLAIGASPAMVHATGELGNAVPIVKAIGGAVSINIGTLDEHWIKSFEACVELCKANDVPWVLDPVAAGFTTLRTETAVKLMEIHPPAVLRGNGSEITALNGAAGGGKGVDSTEGSDAAVGAAKELAAKFNCVVCVSGATDYIVAAGGEGPVMTCPHGHEMLTKVTACGKGAWKFVLTRSRKVKLTLLSGTGCLISSVIGAFVAARPEDTTVQE